jgi:glycosyltransferase involved in cell wall biosynthesis
LWECGTGVEVIHSDIEDSILGQLAGRSKIFSPIRNFSAALRKNPSSFVYHGLSNINLPVTGGQKKRARAIRFVLTVHDLIPMLVRSGDVSWSSRTQFKALLPWALRNADAVIVVSEWTRSTLLEHFPDQSSKIQVIPNGFPLFFAKLPKREIREPSPLRLLTVGRGEPYKRQRLFLDILSLGGGKLFGTLVTSAISRKDLSLAKELSARGWLEVSIAPASDKLIQHYLASDLYLQTSYLEGFCLPAAEAQACGLPVIFTSGSGIDEVVCKSSGYGLPQTAGTKEWLDTIFGLSNGLPEGLQELRAQAFSWATSRPSWLDAANSLKNLYNSL